MHSHSFKIMSDQRLRDRAAKKEKERLEAMDKLVGAGPMGADTQTMWIEEISRLCVLGHQCFSC